MPLCRAAPRSLLVSRDLPLMGVPTPGPRTDWVCGGRKGVGDIQQGTTFGQVHFLNAFLGPGITQPQAPSATSAEPWGGFGVVWGDKWPQEAGMPVVAEGAEGPGKRPCGCCRVGWGLGVGGRSATERP